MGKLTILLALTCAVAAVPGVAEASTVQIDPATGVADFVGGDARNDVTITPFGSNPFPGPALSFDDAAQQLTAGTGCADGLPVWCPGRRANVSLGGGNDRLRHGNTLGSSFTVTGGTGADDIDVEGIGVDVSGGPGADRIGVGGDSGATVNGDDGNDNISGDGIIAGSARFSGGDGNDLVYGSYWASLQSLSGDGGDDSLLVRVGTATGGAGKDVIVAVPPFRTSRTLDGGTGADTIVGAPGTDTVSSGGGDDVIDVSGDAGQEAATPDTVECGLGNDTVYADADDIVANDCETRLDGPMPPSKRVDAALARLANAFGVTIRG